MRLLKILWKIGYKIILPLLLLDGLVALCVPEHSTAQGATGIVAFVLFFGYVCLLALVAGCLWGKWSMETAIQATQPIPGPDEIAFRLYQEWGRPPTATEVQVVQQALINHRNEQAVVGALSLGAIYVAGRHI